jgi:hypothetical protein
MVALLADYRILDPSITSTHDDRSQVTRRRLASFTTRECLRNDCNLDPTFDKMPVRIPGETFESLYLRIDH